MEYTVEKLARLSGVSGRTLRYYDGIGLLRPCRVSSAGYRIYGAKELDRLQQILFYRELGVELSEIGRLLDAPDYDAADTLKRHLEALTARRLRLDALIGNVEKTIRTMEGADTMTDKEKFEGFKKKLVDDNERDYGAEARKSYGDDAVDASNARVMGMSKEKWQEQEELRLRINETLAEAVKTGDPAGKEAMEVCELHRKWLIMFWGPEKYSKAAHMGLGEMYAADERFAAYYGEIAPNAAEFFREALKNYCK